MYTGAAWVLNKDVLVRCRQQSIIPVFNWIGDHIMSPIDPIASTGVNERGNVRSILIVVMGVSGTGKSTLGLALANELKFPFVEGDDLHPKSNVEKMSASIPLNDADREPWLKLIRTTVEQLVGEQRAPHLESNNRDRLQGVVVGCSALKKYYRDILRGQIKPASKENTLERSAHPEVIPTYFVYIDGPRDLLFDRMEKRPGHFMKASMLDSQLNTLEKPIGEEGVVTVSLEISTEEQINIVKRELVKLIGRNL